MAITYVVHADAFFVEYLETAQLLLELNQAHGLDYDPIACGRFQLKKVLKEVEMGQGERLNPHDLRGVYHFGPDS